MTENRQWHGKHLLLLSGPMGSGHIQAAAALATCARERYPGLTVTTINVQEFMAPWLRNIFTKYYMAILNRVPLVWKFVYSRLDSSKGPTMFSRFLEHLRFTIKQPLMARIAELRPDYIVCTHFLPAEILNMAKSTGEFHTPVSIVGTDFSLHHVYVRKHLDHFFVTCDDVADVLHSHGIPKDKIYVSGCPIMPAFARQYSSDDIARLKAEFGFPEMRRVIMVMMGGESVGRLDDISKTILNSLPDSTVVAMAGRSHRTFQRLRAVRKKFPGRMFAVPFTTRMADYLAVSDFVITKPGGLSISECLALQKPVILLDPIPGHEEKNAEYLMREALVAAKVVGRRNLARKGLLPEGKKLEDLSSRLSQYRRPMAGFDILAVALEGKDNCRYG